MSLASGATLDLGGFSNSVGSLAGAGTVTTSAPGPVTLTTGGNDTSTTFSGSLTDGSGQLALTKTGSGTLILSGDSTFSGGTVVQEGSLLVNGSVGDVTVGAGILGGSGTVGNTAVGADGTFAPGNSIGTTQVAGDVSFASGSTYEVEVKSGGAVAGTHNDYVDASGAASIDSGASVNVLAENGTDDGSGYADLTTYTILTADGGVTGTFGSVTENFAFLSGTLTYDFSNVYLSLYQSQAFADAAKTQNQQSVAGAISDLGSGNPIYDAILFQTAPDVRTSFDQLSGEIYASLPSVLAGNARRFQDTTRDHNQFANQGARGGGPSANDTRFSSSGSAPASLGDPFWFEANGSIGSWAANGNSARVASSTYGFLTGTEVAAQDAFQVGIVGGYQKTYAQVPDRMSSASADSFLVGAYGAARVGGANFRFGGSYAWHDVSTTRSVSAGAFSDTLSGRFAGRTLQVFAEAGYPVTVGNFTFEPYAGVSYVNLQSNAFTETGGAAALSVDAMTIAPTFVTLGLRAEGSLDFGNSTLHFHGGVSWNHAISPITPSTQNSFANGATFSINGAPLARNSLALELGVDLALSENASVGFEYGNYLSSASMRHEIRANLEFTF